MKKPKAETPGFPRLAQFVQAQDQEYIGEKGKIVKKLMMLALAATTAFTALPVMAQSLDGKTVTLDIMDSAGGDFGSNSVVAGSGTEGNFFGNQYFSAGSNSFSIRSLNDYCGFSCFGGNITFSLTGLNFNTPITGLLLSTDLSGVSSSFTADTATFKFADQELRPETYLTATFSTGGTTGAVPEPATWAMMMVGFGMIGFGLRRRSKVSTTVRFA